MADDETPTVEPGTMTVTEVTALVQLFNGMLLAMEGRLIAKFEDSARLANERWHKHDADLERNRASVVSRFEKVEAAILVIEQSLKAHLDKEHDENVVLEARVRPVKTVATTVVKNWRTIVLVVLSILALLDFSVGGLREIVR